ncbi:hypothetical protein BDV37DRAFT_227993 [Aspergillus pseudonomiae]|uniref:Uncharacterized protein n=1 Tax=Aspergillus pseudonomiae TaxID=1506151 RepID=A0A5N7D0H8_9EURO|nr:uncharacterized protein BDV37DRAFT_227993 [Aspergillus pseudonomiae]KAE8399597.1 hypothetical protein BDV37DRAFT_227993 [Aspergillus pseudonomiae]
MEGSRGHMWRASPFRLRYALGRLLWFCCFEYRVVLPSYGSVYDLNRIDPGSILKLTLSKHENIPGTDLDRVDEIAVDGIHLSLVAVVFALSGIAVQTRLDAGQTAGTRQAYGTQTAEVDATAGLTGFSRWAVGSGPEAGRKLGFSQYSLHNRLAPRMWKPQEGRSWIEVSISLRGLSVLTSRNDAEALANRSVGDACPPIRPRR